jgi:translocation and assembly module TamB
MDAESPEKITATRRRGLRVVLIVLALLTLMLAVLVGSAWWAARTGSGSAWLLSQVPHLKVSGLKGALLGDFEAQSVSYQISAKNDDRITIAALSWKGLKLKLDNAQTPWVKLTITDLQAARVDVRTTPDPTAPPLKAPTDLRLMVLNQAIEVEVTRLQVGEIHLSALPDQPLRNVQAQLHLGADNGQQHRVNNLSLLWDRLRADASGSIATQDKLPLNAEVKLTQIAATPTADEALAWNATLNLSGPLEQIKTQAKLQAGSAQKPQSLDAQASLRPFAAWPLADLQASTKSLDVSAFASTLPVTALTGNATATSTGLDQPATIQLQLTNEAAGRWNEGKLPLRDAKFEVSAQINNPSMLDVKNLSATLGTAAQTAGTLSGTGRYTPQRWQLDGALNEVQPGLLDSRAAPLLVSGPFTLVGRDFNVAGNAAVDLKGTLTGRLLQGGSVRKNERTAQLAFDLSAFEQTSANTNTNTNTAQRIDVRQFQAAVGDAKATLSGVMQRPDARAAWSVKGNSAMFEFDPLPWWQGPENSAWRQGPHRLNATAEFDVKLPLALFDTALPLPQRVAAVQGQASVNVARSVLAGVPLEGEASLRTAPDGQLKTLVKLDAAGNTVNASGSLAAVLDNAKNLGASDAWTVNVAAPHLQPLAPLWRLVQGGGSPSFSGAINADARIKGRWPLLTTEGQLSASALRVGSFSAKQATARWQAGSSADAPVESEGSVTDAAIDGAVVESLQWQLKGSARAHNAEVRLTAKALPPAWTDALQASAKSSNVAAGTQAVLNVQGGLFAVADKQGEHPAAGWRGTVQKVEAQSSNSAAALLRTRDVGVEVQWSGGPLRAVVQAGQGEVLGAKLRWSRIAWQAESTDPNGAKQAARLDADMTLDAFPIAPVLARIQPDFGWGGDLKVVGSLKLRSSPTFSADVVLERASGDLTVTDEVGTQALELTDLRLGLNADKGIWSFTQGLAGKTLGVAAGAVVARTSPTVMWPPADAPLSGVLEVQVANLGTWGTWIPTGWRVNGGLRTSASIGGRFGAPEYTGEVRGTGIGVRNFLQGVNVSDGDVLIALQGSTARIERFTAKAGAGTVNLEGNAVLGAAPQANLKLRADKFQLLGRVDRRIVASGEAQLQITADKLALDGTFRVDEGLIDFSRSDAPELSDDVQVVRPAGKSAPKSPDAIAATMAAQKPITQRARNVALNLRVDLGDKLRLRGRGLDSGLQGDLRITSPEGKLALNGTVRAVEGTYAAYGQKLTIDRGTITFNGPVENPRLDIQATRPNIDVRVGVNITGNALNPRVRLFSEPEVSEIDKLSWLVLGRASDGLGRTDTALLQRAAMALLAGEGEGLTDQFIKAIGLDEVSLRQSDGDTRETILSLGKQLSRRWYVGYERGLNSTTGTFQLIYRIAQRFTLRAQSGSDNSLDVIWIIRWQ